MTEKEKEGKQKESWSGSRKFLNDRVIYPAKFGKFFHQSTPGPGTDV